MSLFDLQVKRDFLQPKTQCLKYCTGYGKANGTFGELMQGVLPCDKAFMVTFPVNLFSYATFIPNTATDKITVYPQHKTKSSVLAYKLLNTFNVQAIGGDLIIESELSEGKGLASSSADLVATAYAVASSMHINISNEMIENLIYSIEPSDGVMYQGVVAFDYKKLKLIKNIGSLPEIVIIAIDEGSQIDTVGYNAIHKTYSSKNKEQYQTLLTKMIIAIQNKNLYEIGKIATESAIMNQCHNPKKFLQDLIVTANKIHALGVCVAHSGTFVGIMLDPTLNSFNLQKSFCMETLKKLSKDITTFYSIDFDKIKYKHTNFNQHNYYDLSNVHNP